MSGFADLPPLADDIEAGLAAYMTDPELSPSPAGRAAAIETILRDWLVAHSYMGAPPDPAPIRLDSEGVNREEVQYPGFIK
ncbi:hypothetical protein ACI2KT_28910 [Ensifer adhaerens]|jgi:hypothetical protein|uniref:Uncharacterized protein n=1 Tax=Ensifer adhaerens TaxID=106592 RepID=A0ABY8HV40_ENSAD|nr:MULTISPECIES: hypothetical protein [Ensifer]KSV67057.1 hypothetical protein N185_31230 [Sinorhizobium sp. GW3]OWZ91119.1 hypothetical protein B9J07_23910 [Sinorhizobium sp. LM21]ANK76942.1 hypothetical protein FA04_30100 [Ensifer adhaerens]KDP72561.1 hypothetical protein FA04_16615 [Ensifer adhaerens]KQX25777.1 hypothetical protein ASD01_25080 [Ensifer sp. Root423]